jgi:hypothetical protein
MPFTPAHPAIVLPLLRKKWVSATGLVIGSLSPDFEYFFKLGVNSQHSHTLAGLFYFDLPVTLLLAMLFHEVVKRNLIHNLPTFLQRRLQTLLHFDFRNFLKMHWLIFITSALIGAASHIFWDSFTHARGLVVRNFPFFMERLVHYDGVRYPVFYALQHFSTAVGLTAVFVYVMAMKPLQGRVVSPTLGYWCIIAAVTSGVVAMRFMIDQWNPKIGNQVVSLISGLCLAMVVAGLVKFKTITVNHSNGEENSVGAGRKA